jgi:hypothetical protein
MFALISLVKSESPICQTKVSGFDSFNSVVSFVKFQNYLFTPLGDIKRLSKVHLGPI